MRMTETRMRRYQSHVFAIVTISIFWLLTPVSASACVVLPLTYVGSKSQKAAWEKRIERNRKAAVVIRQREFRNGVRSGSIDSASGLANLLIPNIREWYADKTDCGPGGDGDGPTMPKELMFANVFAGSELDGLGGTWLADLISASFIRGPLDRYHRDCSAEFRAGFANQLQIAVSRREREKVLLRLSNSGRYLESQYRFADPARTARPEPADHRPAKILSRISRPVAVALERFWADARWRLASSAQACPKAHERLVAAREIELDPIRKRPS